VERQVLRDIGHTSIRDPIAKLQAEIQERHILEMSKINIRDVAGGHVQILEGQPFKASNAITRDQPDLSHVQMLEAENILQVPQPLIRD
jgi:hypothetical protein